MAVYSTDFSEYTTGQQPSDWTEAWHTDVAETSVVAGGDYGGKSAKVLHSSNNRYACYWDTPGMLSDVDILAKFRVEDSTDGAARAYARVSGYDSTETGYFVDVHSDTNEIELWTYYGATAGQLGSAYSVTINTGTEYWMRLNVSGPSESVTVKAKVWQSGSSEPGSWQLNETSVAAIASGYVGIGSYKGATGVFYDYFSVATSGSAPMPPTTSPGSGSVTITGQSPDTSFVSPAAGSVSLSGAPPTYLNANLFPTPAGSVTITGQVPTYFNPMAIPIPTRQVRFTGFAPTLQDSVVACELPLLEVAVQTGENANVAVELPLLSQTLYSGAQTAVELPLLTAAASADVGVKAEVACELPILSAASQGGALCSCELPLFTVAAAADAEILAQTACTLPLLKAGLTADNERMAQVACSLPLLTVSATTKQSVKTTVGVLLPLLQASLSGETGELADVACELPLLSVDSDLTYQPNADIALSLPLLAMGGDYYPGMEATVAGRFDSYILRFQPPA